MNNLSDIFNNDSYIILFLISYFIIVVIAIISFIRMMKLNKEYKKFMIKLGNGENISEVLNMYMNQVDRVNNENKEIRAYCEKINNDIDGCMQKIGMVRYNAFKDVGSNLSFAVAILDNNNTGIVLNGIYGLDSSNIYAKPIKNGSSTYKLSDEEISAINIAIQKKNFEEKYK